MTILLHTMIICPCSWDQDARTGLNVHEIVPCYWGTNLGNGMKKEKKKQRQGSNKLEKIYLSNGQENELFPTLLYRLSDELLLCNAGWKDRLWWVCCHDAERQCRNWTTNYEKQFEFEHERRTRCSLASEPHAWCTGINHLSIFTSQFHSFLRGWKAKKLELYYYYIMALEFCRLYSGCRTGESTLSRRDWATLPPSF